MNFTLEDFDLEAQSVEVVHPKYGPSGAHLKLRPAADAINSKAADAYRAVIESKASSEEKIAASTVFVGACVEGWPEDSNGFFLGLEYSPENLQTVLKDPRATWITTFIMGAIADPENFTSSQLRKLAE